MLRNSVGGASTRFRVLELLGSGSFGAVVEALDTRTGQRVALKELGSLQTESLARFKQEFRALVGCHHPNLVSLKELIEQDGRWLIVMELVPGQDFLDFVRTPAGGRPFDEGRLREALLGMARGLVALHGYGVLHRDLKPSNVRVTDAGRAVLLDFGLATSVDPSRQSSHNLTLGTIAYMAPEQALRAQVGPAADWYAFGVCLFQALTGQLPFQAEVPFQILLDKQQRPAPRASSLVADIPPDLDELCAALLATNPDARAGAREVLHAFGESDRGRAGLDGRDVAGAVPFAGREIELQHLEVALSRTHEGELQLVLVEGESGVGKSELVAQFVRQARTRAPELVTLSGRCYENEQVAYKAFDGCIDELAVVLRAFDEQACAALLPPRAALLAQLFPVLRAVGPIARVRSSNLSADPTARRLEAFTALARLLSKLAEEHPLVLTIDDLQWADAESFRLLEALLQQPEPPPLLIIATIRPHQELEPEVAEHLEALRRLRSFEVIKLLGLPLPQARALAEKLLGERAQDDCLRVIAEESGGHPLFLAELVQFTLSHDFGARSLTLEAALQARIERLDSPARELLELIALAGRPYGTHIFARALGVDSVEAEACTILSIKLVRTRRAHELGCYHDRIRHTAVGMIARARLPGLHRRLAEALASDPEADASEQARHWDLAGERAKAIDAYERAAARALELLAFVRAAELCKRALELAGASAAATADEQDRRQRLTIQRAHALACTGQSAEAALLFQQAADRAQGETRIRLRSRHARQLMLSAQLTQGYAAARRLLRELGIAVPAGRLAWFARFVRESLWITLHARLPWLRARSLDPRARIALEVLDELRHVFASLHPAMYPLLAIQRMRLASALSSPIDLAITFASRGWIRTVTRSLAAAVPLFEQSRKLLPTDSPPLLVAGRAHVEGSARLAGWDFVGASTYLHEAQRVVQEHCPDQPWLLTVLRFHLGAAWYQLGEHARLARETDVWLAEARERKDALAAALITGMGHGFIRHLMHDAPEQALEALEQAIAALPKEPYSFAHFGYMIGVQHALLYQGGTQALPWLDAYEAEHRGVLFLRSRLGRETLLLYRNIGTLRAIEAARGPERAALMRAEEAIVRSLAKSRSPFAQAQARLASAQLHALAGRRARALEDARAARAALEGLRHVLLRSALFLEGVLEGGASGREKCERAQALMREQGWRKPERLLQMAVPLLGTLHRQEAGGLPASSGLLRDTYQVLRARGGGGFGSVVEARDVHTGRSLALKELVRGNGSALERFKREFRALRDVHHANLVRLDALFEHDGTWYIAMELVEGSDLLAYVRPHGRLDLERLRRAFGGLCEGLAVLHAAGFVHRDLKPENVRVTSAGRTVLLDFGLIARVGARDQGPVGSMEYAAPEQLEGAVAAPSADVYALAICLYQALTGTQPYRAETPALMISRKRRWRPRAIAPCGADELAATVLRALAPAAKDRPSLHELQAVLSSEPARGSTKDGEAAAPRVSDRPARFAGREAELARLAEAFEATPDEGFTLAFVEGESGLGKSALVGEFGRGLAERYPRLLLLESRCYENEQVAFKAFDGAVDHLAETLRALPNPEWEALLPKRAALLAQLFPVLGSVPMIAQATKKGLPAEPSARRRLAIVCFIELLANLATRYELLFIVDDLQWADTESFRLLRALAERKQALPLLFVCTVRPEAELEPDAARELASLRCCCGPLLELSLTGLDAEAARAFADDLYGAPLPPESAERLFVESKGHPLFLRELVALARCGHHSNGALTLDQALRVRISGFDPAVRDLLSLAALADRPLGMHVFARALDAREIPREVLVTLSASGLLRRSGEQLTCYHDRIRQVALGLLAPDARRALASALAQALEGEGDAHAAERARLWEDAGEAKRAIDAHELAGDLALEGLAFMGAEHHYARALALLGVGDFEARAGAREVDTEAWARESGRGATEAREPGDDARFRRIVVQRGHALARAGRSAEAARAFQLAAAHAEGETQMRLQIWAARHLIQSVHVEEGLAAASDLLGGLGITLPESDRAARLRIIWERARVAIRGIALKPRTTPMSERERLVLDALHGLSSPVRAVSYLAGSTLIVRYLRLALDAGEPIHAARAFAYEALLRSTRDPSADTTPLFAHSRALAGDTPVAQAEVELVWGLASIARGDFAEAAQHLALAHELLVTRCPGEPWLLTSARMYLGSAWLHGGDFAAIASQSESWVEEARSRDDRYALAALTGFGGASLRHLLRDDPEGARRELDDAMAPWDHQPFSTIHLGAIISRGYVFLYRGGAEALAWIDRDIAPLMGTFLLQTPTALSWLATYRVIACFNAADAAYVERNEQERRRLLERARAEIRALSRSSGPVGEGLVSMCNAGLLTREGKRDEALALARKSVGELSQKGHFVRGGAQYLLGVLEGGEAGRALCEAVIVRLREHGWVRPEKAVSMFFPAGSGEVRSPGSGETNPADGA